MISRREQRDEKEIRRKIPEENEIMKNKTHGRKVLMLLIVAAALFLTACAGGSSGPQKYKWDDAEFTVKNITDDESAVGKEAGNMSGKCVAVIIDFGDGTISQSKFEKRVANGQFLLSGKKPSTYDYHMANMTFSAGGFETQITGETTIYFDMDPDYEIKDEDLVITE